jgi:hypothetical protein
VAEVFPPSQGLACKQDWPFFEYCTLHAARRKLRTQHDETDEASTFVVSALLSEPLIERLSFQQALLSTFQLPTFRNQSSARQDSSLLLFESIVNEVYQHCFSVAIFKWLLVV